MSSQDSMEVITLDDSSEVGSQMNGSVEVVEEDDVGDAAPNLSVANATVVNFDATLPAGVAPAGFVILDEEVAKESPSASPERVAPTFRVAFRDDETYRKYHKKIKDFFKDLLGIRYDKEKSKSSDKDLTIEVFESDSETPIDFYFTLDSEPQQANDFDVPVYGKKFNQALEKGKLKEPEKKDEHSAPKMTCFNCLGNHSMRDCPKPKNLSEISKNRKDYYNVRRTPSNARYHTDEDQKFGHFAPGQMSSKLRKALGLKENELPRHIYRMRMLGYPPGWLEEARLQHSGLTLFDSSGAVDYGSDEEGEIISPGDKDRYDIKKIIDFPGFNVPTPQGTKDEYMQYWGSIEQLNSSKEAMEAVLSHKKADEGYKRKKFRNPANSRPAGDVNPGEMEIDTVEETPVECVPVKDLFIPPLPKETDAEEPPPPPPPSVPDDCTATQMQEDNSNAESNGPSSGGNSPTLRDLEVAKKQLLAELNESSSQSNPDFEKSGELAADSSNGETNQNSSIAEVSKTESSQNNSLNTSSVNCDTPKTGHKMVKSVHLGTPILNSCSPYRRLPNQEKFSKDICDVINFENLPDSTGKYDQMTELLQKVRRTLTDLHKE